jgi:hypothetical protein
MGLPPSPDWRAVAVSLNAKANTLPGSTASPVRTTVGGQISVGWVGSRAEAHRIVIVFRVARVRETCCRTAMSASLAYPHHRYRRAAGECDQARMVIVGERDLVHVTSRCIHAPRRPAPNALAGPSTRRRNAARQGRTSMPVVARHPPQQSFLGVDCKNAAAKHQLALTYPRSVSSWIPADISLKLRRFHQMNHGCGVGVGWRALGLMAKPVVGLWLWAR